MLLPSLVSGCRIQFEHPGQNGHQHTAACRHRAQGGGHNRHRHRRPSPEELEASQMMHMWDPNKPFPEIPYPYIYDPLPLMLAHQPAAEQGPPSMLNRHPIMTTTPHGNSPSSSIPPPPFPPASSLSSPSSSATSLSMPNTPTSLQYQPQVELQDVELQAIPNTSPINGPGQAESSSAGRAKSGLLRHIAIPIDHSSDSSEYHALINLQA
ncbi:hypothetical protein H4R33_005435 [Dimargaris cristalligena]|nr:hypothetical protein H4R33_005435 [Dimargaris cristalligena]